MKNPALDSLTGMRFFAAIYVVIFHYPGIYNPILPLKITTFAHHGYAAVGFFFVLSGFILTYNYSHLNFNKSEKLNFYLSRFSRIYPAYIFAFINLSSSFFVYT